MPSTHFNQWAEYFYECYKDTVAKEQDPAGNFPGHWKYFMMSNILFMATRRKVGVEKMKFAKALQDAPTLMDKVKVFLSDKKLAQFTEKIAKELYSNDSYQPIKCKSVAEMELSHGDKCMENGDAVSALHHFNNAIIRVPWNEDDLVLQLYQRRLLALLNMERITEALQDIDAIVLHESISKETAVDFLETTVEMCKENGWENLLGPFDAVIEMVKNGEDYKSVPKAKRCPIPHDPSNFTGSNLDGSSDALKLVVKEGKGRCLVADRDIDIGESLIMEKAFITQISGEARLDYCYNCVEKLNGRFEPCHSCNDVLFCSEFCREESLNGVHKLECGHVDAMEYLTSGCVALRAILIGGAEKVLEEFRNPKPIEHWTKNRLCTNYEGFYSLLAHSSNVNDVQLQSILLQASIGANFAKLIKAVPQDTDIIELATIMLSNIFRSKVNAWAIYDSSHKQCGSAIFVSFSMPNHSCEPNSCQIYAGNTMISSATRPIKEGEEVTMSYGPLAGVMGVTERMAKLREVYDFECECNGCMRDMSRYASLNYDNPPPDFRELKRQQAEWERQSQSSAMRLSQMVDEQVQDRAYDLSVHSSYQNDRKRRYALTQATQNSGYEYPVIDEEANLDSVELCRTESPSQVVGSHNFNRQSYQ